MQPDNDHLHNRVYRYFKTLFKSKMTANLVMGLSVALGSSGFVLLSFLRNFIPLQVIYGLVFFYLDVLFTA